MLPKIQLTLINYNGAQFLKKCIASLLSQTYQNFHLTIIDNVSTDESVSILNQNFANNPKVTITQNPENNGYTGAANQACEFAVTTGAKYLMILNPDIVFNPDYLEKAITILEQDSKIAAFTGKIRRYDWATHQKTNLIDTVGLKCFPNRRVVDYGQGQQDKGQFDEPAEVFGVSGACPIYRTAALQDAAINGEVFDEDFFLYKEDIDISWRLRLRGWKIFYHPSAIAYHGRGTGVLKEFSHKAVFKNRRHSSQLAKYYAFKNQRLMQIKNEQFPNILRDVIPILTKEILIFGYIIFREPRLLKSVAHLLRQIPGALSKRREIKKSTKISPPEMRQWFR